MYVKRNRKLPTVILCAYSLNRNNLCGLEIYDSPFALLMTPRIAQA